VLPHQLLVARLFARTNRLHNDLVKVQPRLSGINSPEHSKPVNCCPERIPIPQVLLGLSVGTKTPWNIGMELCNQPAINAMLSSFILGFAEWSISWYPEIWKLITLDQTPTPWRRMFASTDCSRKWTHFAESNGLAPRMRIP
jgi:hypothetical protein